MPRTTEGIANDRGTTTPRGEGAASTPRTGPTPPVKLHRPDVALTDKYLLEQGTVFLSGTQALVRILLDQVRADRRRGLRTATFVSGYQGSPLGTVDKEILGLGEIAPQHDLHFTAGLNEELAATAVYGSQMAPSLPGAKVDGVTGVWYGKNPGLDRAMDALRHANFAGTHPHGGALALVGDDPSCKSSTLPSAGEATLAALHMPTFFPGTLQEVLDFGLHAIACSRASGLWSAMKVVTNIADAAGTVSVWPERVGPVIPTVDFEGQPYVHAPNGNLLTPASMELERTLFGPRMEIARQYAALNQLNLVTVPTRDAWLGVVAAGKVYYELVQALSDLGLDQRALERAGVRLMKVGMLYPHDREAFRAFGRGLDEVLVVEEKLPFLETALRDALYGTPDAPRIVGKRDEHDAPLLSPESARDADAIALAHAARLRAGGRGAPESVAARVAQIEARRATTARTLPTLARTPMFCSGCPHNTSTANPDDTLLGAGIGCHTMILLSPEGKGTITGITQMGGEGAQFVGMKDFTDDRHFVQNVGDGTFHHSASLAIRFAVSAQANVTYKLLYNRTVAMTGGQDVVGGMTVPELTRWLALEGVAKIVITTEDPKRYKNAGLDPIASVRHRDALPEAQAELARTPGVTVLLHDQHCAAELRRLRKRGKAPEPAQRVEIDERVCEGCGDCGTKSNCMSVLPVQTEFGRKTQIHQSSCNKDFSCLKGDCPSFLTVIPAKAKDKGKTDNKAVAFPLPPRDRLPEPTLKVSRDSFLMRMPGVGGTGVVTVSQILQMAAMLDGKHSYGLDQTGLAQKGGPVVSDVRIARDPIEGSSTASAGAADLLLGFDVLGAANPKNLLVADPAKTVAVVNTHATPTAAMVTDTGVRFPARDRNVKAIEKATRAGESVFFDAEALSLALFGDHMPTNTLLIGAAYQAGCLPLSADALEQAIRLNGAAVEKNLAAFAWGRAVVAAPQAVAEATAAANPAPAAAAVAPLDGEARAIVEASGATGELRRLLEVRVPELMAYGSAALARDYAEDVMRVAAAEAAQGAPGETAVAEAYARGLHKLLAYKDEYEVARLHLMGLAEAEPGSKVYVMLHPPLLRAMGLQRKLKVRRGVAVPLFRTLRATRRLRGTPLDPFGRAEVRRVERALPEEYRALVDRALARLTPVTHATVARIADLPDVVRGYEDVKLRNVEAFREQAARLEDELARGAQSGGFSLPIARG